MDGLLRAIRRELLTEDRLRAAVADVNRRLEGRHAALMEEHRRLEREIAVASRSIERLLDAIEAGQSPSSLRDWLAQRERERSELQADLQRLDHEERRSRPIRIGRQALRAAARHLKEALASGDPERVKPVLQGVVRRVTLYNDRARVAFCLPSALFADSTHDRRAMLGYPQGDSNP